MRKIARIIPVFGAAFFVLAVLLSSCSPVKHVPADKNLLADVKIKCDNKDIDYDDLESTLKQKPNRRTLSIFRFHLFAYNIAKAGKERKWKNKIANVVGEPPVIYDESLQKRTAQTMEYFLSYKGYYHAVVTDTVKIKRRRAKTTFTITTGKPHLINNIRYDVIDDSVRQILLADSVNSLIKIGDPLDLDVIEAEQARIVKIMKNNGYFSFSINNIHFYADTTQQAYQAELTMAIRQSFNSKDSITETNFRKYIIGDVFVFADFDQKRYLLEKEEYMNSLTKEEIEGYQFYFNHHLRIKPVVLIQTMFVKKGETYNLSFIEKTHRHLSNLKQFKLINIDLVPSPDDPFVLNTYIYLTPLVRQSYSAELEGTNSSGNLGAGAIITYTNRNLLRGAESFSVKTAVSLQTLTHVEGISQRFLNTLEASGELRLDLPKLMIPFYRNDDFVKNKGPKTQFSISTSYSKRPDYTRLISNATVGYYWKGGRNNYVTHFLNPIEFYQVRIWDFDPEFMEDIQNYFIRYSYENQFISVISYDMLFSNQNINKPGNFWYIWLNVETAGNLIEAAYELSNQTPVEGSYQLFGTEFAQFAKTDLDLRYYNVFNKKHSLVYRAYLGVGLPYGNSRSNGLPFIKKYFTGGANDIRAWQVRTLGPGSYTSTSAFNQMADMKLMFNMEYRFDIASFLEGAVFLDAGNIWAIDKNDDREGALFKWNNFYKEIALGTGLGARFDFSFFIIRFDFGVPLYDPGYPIGERWLGTFSSLEFSDFTFNFGIGYPF
ncbi:MAG TPA: BamA/TamA family outer membrane protein [Bacteroidales bacterium]|nr:BamA/TamA family outer membrane protein [Bacteroidales bacterium]